MRSWAGGASLWRSLWLFLLLPAQGLPHHWLKQQPDKAPRTQGWRREAGVLLALLPAQFTRTFGFLSGLEGKRHREKGQFQAIFFSLPLSHCPTLAALLNSSPWHFQAVKLHTAAERRAGIKLVTHLHRRVTQPLHTQIRQIGVHVDTASHAQPAVQGAWGVCIFVILHQPSGAEACPTLQRQHRDWFIKPDSLRQSARRLSCWWGVLMLSAAHMSIGQLLPVQSPLWEKFRARFGMST